MATEPGASSLLEPRIDHCPGTLVMAALGPQMGLIFREDATIPVPSSQCPVSCLVWLQDSCDWLLAPVEERAPKSRFVQICVSLVQIYKADKWYRVRCRFPNPGDVGQW